MLMGGARANETGSGPLKLSPDVVAFYENNFLQEDGRLFFAVSENGRHAGLTTCPEFRCRETGARTRAVAACQRASKGAPCYIYANRNGVIWDGPVTVAETAAEAGGEHAEGSIVWNAGTPEAETYSLYRFGSARRGAFSLNRPDGSLCTGEYGGYSGDSGSWSLGCSDGTTVSGRFEVDTIKLHGEGADSDGRPVYFFIAK